MSLRKGLITADPSQRNPKTISAAGGQKRRSRRRSRSGKRKDSSSDLAMRSVSSLRRLVSPAFGFGLVVDPFNSTFFFNGFQVVFCFSRFFGTCYKVFLDLRPSGDLLALSITNLGLLLKGMGVFILFWLLFAANLTFESFQTHKNDKIKSNKKCIQITQTPPQK